MVTHHELYVKIDFFLGPSYHNFSVYAFIGHGYGRCFLELPNFGNKSSASTFLILPNRLYAAMWRYENKRLNLKKS